MKQLLAIFIIIACTLTACAPLHEVSHSAPDHTTAVPEANSGTAVSFQAQADQLIALCALFFPENATAYIKGKTYPLPVAPFFEEGVLYVPAAQVCAALGGSFVDAGDYYYINYMGNVSIIMESYNILLFNSDAVIMDRTPIVRQEQLCLPLSALGTALSRRYAKNADAQVYVLGGQEYPSAQVLCCVRQTLLGETVTYQPQPELAMLAESYALDLSQLEQAADLRTLWRSDAQGCIHELWLDDAGVLHTSAYTMTARFPEDQLFIEQNGMLYSLCTGQSFSSTAEHLYRQELRQATGRYMELLAASSLHADSQAEKLLAGYRNAIAGDLTDPVYTADLDRPYATGLYDNQTGNPGWEELVKNARPGDFLVFSAAGAGAEYGFFNHSALILEADRQTCTLRLLHARNSELGVGADRDMDRLTYDGFYDLDYYKGYEVVFLCRAGDLSASQAQILAAHAYSTFQDYQFGYGGSLGLKETNCAELIVDAYAQQGISILDSTYETRLKEVLKGNTKNLVPIPDDLLFSPATEVIAVWKR